MGGRAGRRRLPRGARRARPHLRGPAHPAHARRALRPLEAALPEARGPAPHRRAQAEQRARPGGAGAPARQEPDRGRDGRRPARRRDGHRLRALRARMRGLHGRRGHAPAAPERRADGPPGRRGAAGRVRHAHAEGGDERGDPRLDHVRRDDALPDRLVRGACAVPRDRARAPGGDRARGAGPAARGRRTPAGGRARVRRRRLERDRHVRGLRRRRRRRAGRRRGGGRCEPRHRPRRRPPRLALLRARGRGRPDRRRSLHLGRPRLSRRRARARVPARLGSCPLRGHDRRGGAGRVPAADAHRGDHSRARARARAGARGRARRASWSSSASPAAATRISPRCWPAGDARLSSST